MPLTRKPRYFFRKLIRCVQSNSVLSKLFGSKSDKIVPQGVKDPNSKSNGNAGLIFLKSLTKLLPLIDEGKFLQQLRPFFSGGKLIALVKIDGGLQPVAIGNTLRRIASKCARSKVLADR